MRLYVFLLTVYYDERNNFAKHLCEKLSIKQTSFCDFLDKKDVKTIAM